MIAPPIEDVVPEITTCVPPGASETTVPDTVMAEPPGVKVCPSMTTLPEGLTKRVVPATTGVEVGEAGTEPVGFWLGV